MMPSFGRCFRLGACAAGLMAELGCNESTLGGQTEGPLLVAALTPGRMEGVVGSPVAGGPTIVINDQAGHPIANLAVEFQAGPGRDRSGWSDRRGG